MAMLGIEFMGDVPFRQVYIHGLVRDADKQKMSKTKGNVIDPLIVTEQYGTDAVRMALLSGAAPGTDIVFTSERLQSSRAFANKLWNAARFILSSEGEPAPPALEDRWIVSRLNTCAGEMNKAIEKHRYHEAAHLVWHFIYDDFCDWYIELKKVHGTGYNNAITVFEEALRLLHPCMPFITEELWHRIGEHEGHSISTQPYPEYKETLADPDAEKEIGLLQDVVTAARGIRADLGLDPKLPLTGTITVPVNFVVVEKLARVKLTVGDVPKTGAIRNTAAFDLALEVPHAQQEAQTKRIAKELEQLEKNIANSHRQLNDESFMSKAPAKVIDSIRAKLAEYEKQRDKLNGSN
jgi:valyl-tRNA synthetase